MANPLEAFASMTGSRARAALVDVLAIGDIFARTLRAALGASPGSRRLVLRTSVLQIYFTGVQALPVSGLLALLFGLGLGRLVEERGAYDFLPLLTEVLAYYLGPIVAAVLIITRSAAAVAVELGNMRVAGETRMLESFGIDPYPHLALPRVLGIVVGSIALCYTVTAIALAAMVFVVRDHPSVAGADYILTVAPKTGPRVAVLGLFYGLIIALVAIRQGLQLIPQYTEVPKAASRAVVKSLVLCALVTAVVSVVMA